MVRNFIPTVVESGEKGERSFDIYSKLLRDRILFLSGPVDSCNINSLIAQLLFLESEDKKKDITLYIDSPGGSIVAGYSLMDTMELITPDVATIITGMAYSMGSVIAAAGAKGKRMMLPRAEHMIHQPMTGAPGGTQCSDFQISAVRIQKMKDELTDFYKSVSKMNRKQVEKIMDRDTFIDSQKCLELGLVDKIIKHR